MRITKQYYVYIMSNTHKNMIYVGVTNNLKRRVNEHHMGIVKGFTYKFNCKYLVYYEVFNDINQAICREKTIKKFRREKKNNLILQFNPEWKFLNKMVAMTDDKYL
ncbi:MAG: GIY-YIG nuclease family protein [Bacteroidetes bacterium]|nr:MAG: GIY-YIG nuclease family protein [Bacteroidota bacterium]